MARTNPMTNQACAIRKIGTLERNKTAKMVPEAPRLGAVTECCAAARNQTNQAMKRTTLPTLSQKCHCTVILS